MRDVILNFVAIVTNGCLATQSRPSSMGNLTFVGSLGQRFRCDIATGGNTARNTVGGIGSNVDVQGVTVINGRVYIDNKEIPPDVTRYKSPRTGEVYIIKRKGGSVEVTSDAGAKK